MTLLRPWALVLLLGLVPLLALARTTPTSSRLRRLARGLRLVVLALVVVALAGPVRPVPSAARAPQVALVADVSSSVVREAVIAAVESESTAAWPADVTLVTAADGAREGTLDDGEPDPNESDLAAGVRLGAATLRDPDQPARLVLISDGRPTRGDVAEEARRLEARGVGVREVRVASRTLSLVGARPSRSWVRSGEPLRVEVEVGAAGSLTVERTIQRLGRSPEGRRWSRAVRPGRVSIDDRPRGRGLANYSISLNGERLSVVVPVRRPPRARILTDPLQTGALVARALREGGFEVALRPPSAGAEGMGAEDLLVLVDVSAKALPASTQAAVVGWVREGGGLFVLGGERAFGPGGYRGSRLEEALPVLSEPSTGEQPTLALVLIVDRSSSMAGPKLELAKLAAGDALAQLALRDQAGAIVFNQRAQWAIPLQRGVESEARGRIEIHAAGGGTDLEPALKLARAALRGASAKIKHLVVMTDGIVPKPESVRARITALHEEGVSVSTVALGGDADHGLLRRLAEAGGGRHHAVPVAADLPRILVRETRRVARLAGRTPVFRARVRTPGEILRGVDVARGPRLLGLADTRARPTATTWLTGHQERPLLAGWDVGAGRVCVWTSDAGVRWARPWAGWTGFPQLLRQVARRLTPARLALPTSAGEVVRVSWAGRRLQIRARRPGQLRVTLRAQGKPAPEVHAWVRAWGVGRGEAAFPDLPAGAYEVAVRRPRAVRTLVALSGVSLPAPGLERRAPIEPVWNSSTQASGGRKRWQQLDLWFLLGALLLLLVEVACRRASR